MWETPAASASSKERRKGWDCITVPRFAWLRLFHGSALLAKSLPYIRSHHSMFLDQHAKLFRGNTQLFAPIFQLIGFVDIDAKTVSRSSFCSVVGHCDLLQTQIASNGESAHERATLCADPSDNPLKSKPVPPSQPLSFIESMECLPVTVVPEGAAWTYEIKLDGYRLEVIRDGAATTLYSRNANILNDRFPYIAKALSGIPSGTILDGELVA